MADNHITISLCMIVRNEENTVARCLDSVQDIVDEIVIVDTGSTDHTKEIIRRYTDKIFDFTWIDDFAAARNDAFSHATMEYILWLDADDVLLEPDRLKFLALKKNLDPMIDAVNMPYLLAFDQFGNVTFSLRRNRLVKRSRNFQWIGSVHEYLEVSGHVFNSDVEVAHKEEAHNSDRNLNIYEKRLALGKFFTPRDLYYFANELFDHRQYERAVEFYKKFLDTGKGWVEDQISTCGKLADCFQNLGDHENEQAYLFRSFEFDTPRAEFCCRLGFYNLQGGKLKQATFWYKLATQIEKPLDSWGHMFHACWTWLPHLQLCVCYDRLGQYALAYEHNEIARTFRPEDPQIIHNKNYLEGVLGLGRVEKGEINKEIGDE
ncbi:glycosyltransferase family 2 protein [Desulfosporosinus metallidurans]|uniref:Glycosyl transferase, group 2 family protein n=1 Tax=Desulfosporosinus metallidurans TaxID=1888891 RepID=A0A1Q8QQE0_9FIRM|nr:glycosyltransferase family 2 protein [Desulfosporosinus metallidurans]OLN29520.1 Glycosyl transferase, group 2 family protein [Desulfosporosinus metallidurans]